MTPDRREPQTLRIPWLLLLAFLFTLLSGLGSILWGRVTTLEISKAEKSDVQEIKADVREIRNYLLGPKR